MGRHTLAKALQRLIARGYLERRFVQRRGYRYRLLFSRTALEVHVTGHDS
jgi:hypothetical protein